MYSLVLHTTTTTSVLHHDFQYSYTITNPFNFALD